MIVLNVVTCLWSAWFIRRIERVEETVNRPVRAHLWQEVREGFHALVGTPLLRATALSPATINLAGWMFLAVHVPYMTGDLGLSATGVGLVFASGGIGALIGSVLAPRLARRAGVGRTLVWSAIAFGAFGLSVPLAILVPAFALPLVIVAECMQWLALVVFNVLALSLRQAITPNRLLGRVAASSQVLAQGMMPVGSFLGGVIGSLVSVQAALLAGVGGVFLAAARVIFCPVRELRDLPGDDDPAVPATA